MLVAGCLVEITIKLQIFHASVGTIQLLSSNFRFAIFDVFFLISAQKNQVYWQVLTFKFLFENPTFTLLLFRSQLFQVSVGDSNFHVSAW